MEKTFLRIFLVVLALAGNLFADQSVKTSGTGGVLTEPVASVFRSANAIMATTGTALAFSGTIPITQVTNLPTLLATGTQALTAAQSGSTALVSASAAIIAQVPGLAPVQSVAGRTGAVTLTKSDVGLSNVVNSDATNASNLSSGTVPYARLPVGTGTGQVLTAASLSNPRTIYVTGSGSNATGSIGNPSLPFSTVSGTNGAYVAAEAASPSQASPVLIKVGAGTFIESSLVTTGSSFVTLAGSGKEATVLSFTGTVGIVISSSNITVSDLSIVRSGASGAKLLHCNTTSGVTFLPGIQFRNIAVTNVSGTAIGTSCAESHNITASGIVAMDWNYGGQNFESMFIAHDPALSATTYAVRDAQTDYNGAATYISSFQACKLFATDPNGRGILGLSESSTGDRSGSNYTPTQPGSVSAFPTLLSCCHIYTIINASETGYTGGYAIRGTLRLNGCEVYGGSNLVSYMHDSDSDSTAFVVLNSGVQPAMMDHVSGSQFVGGRAIASGTDMFTHIDACLFSGMNIQNDAVPQLRGEQYQFRQCLETPQAGYNIIGFDDKYNMVLRLSGDPGGSLASTESSPDYGPPALTVEVWFRSNNDNNGTLTSWYDQADPATWALQCDKNNNRIYTNVGGGVIASGSTPCFDGNWHNSTLTISGTTATLFFDGTSQGQCSITVLSGSSRLLLGAFSAHSPTNAGGYFTGDIGPVRLSSIVRYPGTTTFTPPTHYLPDSSTISLFSTYSNAPLKWTDAIGSHDATFHINNGQDQSYPYWVKRTHTYP